MSRNIKKPNITTRRLQQVLFEDMSGTEMSQLVTYCRVLACKLVKHGV